MKVAYQSRKATGIRCMGILSKLGVQFAPLDECRVAFSVLGSHVYTKREIESVPCGIVNLHLAPLPAYRGFYAFSHAIANGDDDYEVTLHYVDEGIDTGPIIATRSVPMPDTPQVLAYKAQEAGVELFGEWAPKIIAAAEEGERVESTPQPPGGRYYDRNSLPEDQRF